MFNLLLSISPLLYMLYWFLSTRKSENISYDIKMGYKCYVCKSDIDSFDNRMNQLGKNIMTKEHYLSLNKPVCCKPCKRENKLNQLTKRFGFRYKIIADLDRFLLSEKYQKFIWISLSIIVSFLILDLFLLREWRPFFYIGQSIQLIYWIFFIRRQKLTTIKKPNQN